MRGAEAPVVVVVAKARRLGSSCAVDSPSAESKMIVEETGAADSRCPLCDPVCFGGISTDRDEVDLCSGGDGWEKRREKQTQQRYKGV